jgi:hypothetical protein
MVLREGRGAVQSRLREKLNPLYYIGSISYYLIWLIVASGLYLYAFFETSVTGASASVEALTHGQPWAGGVLRSVHRYASDGVVLTMLLHMTRHWAFDHYRGFRWFSWVSGLVLLWLVYVAGINGYMLPWDRLAKFTVIATAEWLDWLPVFNGTLVRNFIFEQNVNDRLFSLLSFIHIGVPLAVLALLWIHTQRVPQARTSPPLPIMLTLTVALIVLAVVKPAVSQSGTGSAELGFDWFYLPVLALLYRWTPGEVWLLVGGATALFLLLPWLPPKKRGAERYMLVRPDNRIVAVRAGETLLDAGLREGIALPLRLPQRRLRRMQGDAALRDGRIRSVPARRAKRGRARRRHDPAVRVHPARGRRDRIRAGEGAGHSGRAALDGERRDHTPARARRDAGDPQARRRRAHRFLRRPVHQHPPRRWREAQLLVRHRPGGQ